MGVTELVMKTIEEDTRFICSHCDKEFKYNSDKIRHEISHYQMFECDICAKKFSYQSALRRHRKQHERTGSVICDKCDRKFKDEILLKRHIEYAHKGTFTCPSCKSTFHSKQALGTHMKTHRPKSERKFTCSYCDKTFNFSHHLKHHEMTHTKTKEYYCNVCGKGFVQSHHLKSHLKIHDVSDKYVCEYPECKRRFTSKYTMRRHMIKHGTKLDSGISSDSNSNKEVSNDSFITCTCGKKIPSEDFEEHTALCIDILEEKIDVKDLVIEIEALADTEEVPVDSPKQTDLDIGDCKTVLGSCITNNNDCICEQINKNTTGDEKVPKDNNNVENYVLNKNVDNKDSQDACEGCDCASICNEKAKQNCSIKKLSEENETPNICNDNGVITLKDTFDLDLKSNQVDEFIPFNTCKDVIGNCIVGGNVDSCLCAKMMADDQRHAQEIEDITPHPKTD